MRAFLDLVRLPNVFTAMADAIAGFLYVGGGVADWPTLLAFVGASSFLYAGGAALNDVRDVDRDKSERPHRPIPSGRVSRGAAGRLAVLLLALGLGCAALAGERAAFVASLLVICIILYDTVDKGSALSPALMGTCRALNLMIAMSGAGVWWSGEILLPLAVMWAYVASLTLLARDEAKGGRCGHRVFGAAGVCISTIGLAGLWWVVDGVHSVYLAYVGMLVIVAGGNSAKVARDPSPAVVQPAVRSLVLAIILLDTCLATASRGVIAGMLVASMGIPALLCARALRVT